MNMAKTKLQKKEIIEDLKQNLTNQKAVIFVDFQGLDAKALSELRDKLKEANCLLKVTKKTLLGLVFESLGDSSLKEKVKNIEGELALIFGFKDEIMPAKLIYQFSQENENLKILGGLIKNEEYKFLTVQEVIDLALLPSKEEVFARLVGTLNAPIANFVNVLRENIKGLIYLLNNLKVQNAKVKTTT
jgi:large subunit ribosomal protein L10